MKMKEIKGMDDAKLAERLIKSREKVRDLRFGVANRQVKNVREIRHLKGDIARILTERSERTAKKKPNAT